MGTALEVLPLVTRRKLATTEDTVSFRSRFGWELRIKLAAVDEQWGQRGLGVFLL
jgi:hypothetical protein